MLIIIQALYIMPPIILVSINSIVLFLTIIKDILAKITSVVLVVTTLLVATRDFLKALRELSEVRRDLLLCL